MTKKKTNKLITLTKRLEQLIFSKEEKGEINHQTADDLLNLVFKIEDEESLLIKGLTDIKHLHI